MNVLITGGAGFIGSHLAEAFLLRGDWVTIIDDLSTGSMHNIAHLKSNRRFEYVIDDVCRREVTAELVDTADIIFHMAAAVGVKLIVDQPTHTISTNLRGTEVVLELAAKKGKRVCIASTSEVYGKRETMPFKEGDDLIMGSTQRARWAYACSKAMDEFMGLAFLRERNLPVFIVRLFNTVGPRQSGRYGMVVPSFVEQAIANKPITVYGDGEQQRCFGYVGDVVKALVALSDTPEAIGRVINIGSQNEISIKELAELTREMAGSTSEITYVPYSEAYGEGFEDMRRRIPCTELLTELVGFAPTTNLRDIVEAVIAEKRQNQTNRGPRASTPYAAGRARA